eukprot:TRINITY_DN25635_c0_g1_i1.p1 TRINITY_DN25635_c0_g1~~TRINITY_DN25635_c0_g1_i1.p1  ORF type:complete len:450 (-),score=102.16 TRINITY_DN25635_c0_g1_i1:88-1437(-)
MQLFADVSEERTWHDSGPLGLSLQARGRWKGDPGAVVTSVKNEQDARLVGAVVLRLNGQDVSCESYEEIRDRIKQASRPLTIGFGSTGCGVKQRTKPEDTSQANAVKQERAREAQEGWTRAQWVATHCDDQKAAQNLGAFAESVYRRLVLGEDGGAVHILLTRVLPKWVWDAVATLEDEISKYLHCDPDGCYRELRVLVDSFLLSTQDDLSRKGRECISYLWEHGLESVAEEAQDALRGFSWEPSEALVDQFEMLSEVAHKWQLDARQLVRCAKVLNSHAELRVDGFRNAMRRTAQQPTGAARWGIAPSKCQKFLAELAPVSAADKLAMLQRMSLAEKSAVMQALLSSSNEAVLRGLSAMERNSLMAPLFGCSGGSVLSKLAVAMVGSTDARWMTERFLKICRQLLCDSKLLSAATQKQNAEDLGSRHSREMAIAVSYTHLTLPTKRIV